MVGSHLFIFGGVYMIRTYARGVAVLCRTTWLTRHIALLKGYYSSHNRVSNIVRSLKILVSKEIGEPIFQRSYYDHVIRNQRDYDEIWQYIENNPRKWFLQKHSLL